MAERRNTKRPRLNNYEKPLSLSLNSHKNNNQTSPFITFSSTSPIKIAAPMTNGKRPDISIPETINNTLRQPVNPRLPANYGKLKGIVSAKRQANLEFLSGRESFPVNKNKNKSTNKKNRRNRRKTRRS